MAGTKRIESAKRLIASGCDINEKDESGRTALYHAVACENEEMARLLIESGADVNSVNDFGQSPLMVAAHNNNLNCVKLLLEHGADVNLKDSIGRTALDLAKEETVTTKRFFLTFHVTRPRRTGTQVMELLKTNI